MKPKAGVEDLKLKKADFILIIVILSVACTLLLIWEFAAGTFDGILGFGEGDNKGRYQVEVRIDGNLEGIYRLDEDMTKVFRFEDGDTYKDTGNYNVMVIKDGKVSVSEADCPDGYCMRKGEIYRKNETIICLPHKLVIKITKSGETSTDIDAIAQ